MILYLFILFILFCIFFGRMRGCAGSDPQSRHPGRPMPPALPHTASWPRQHGTPSWPSGSMRCAPLPPWRRAICRGSCPVNGGRPHPPPRLAALWGYNRARGHPIFSKNGQIFLGGYFFSRAGWPIWGDKNGKTANLAQGYLTKRKRPIWGGVRVV